MLTKDVHLQLRGMVQLVSLIFIPSVGCVRKVRAYLNSSDSSKRPMGRIETHRESSDSVVLPEFLHNRQQGKELVIV